MQDLNPGFYKKLLTSLENNSVLMKEDSLGDYYPIWCSNEFEQMIEGSEAEFIKRERCVPQASIHPDDQETIRFLFKNKKTHNGKNTVTVRKRTLKGNWIWVCIHYAFIKDAGVHYAYCTYFDVTAIKESERESMRMYENMNREFFEIANECLAVSRCNLTKGITLEIRGQDLYDCDQAGAPIAVSLKARLESFTNNEDKLSYMQTFNPQKLLEKFYNGEDSSSVILFCKRQSGKSCFVKFSATARKDPQTGDIIIYGIERECNAKKVTEVLVNKILAEQYDMISFIIEGKYGIVIGEQSEDNTKIIPRQKNGLYMDYIENQVLPLAAFTPKERQELLNKFSISRVELELKKSGRYILDIPCLIKGKLYYKRFAFYSIDNKARFYILLKSDYTELQQEQLERNKRLKDALTIANKANVANIAKTAFLSRMSHELRTPMNAIIGFNTLALNSKDISKQTNNYLKKIESSANFLLLLINDILDMSRIESGHIHINNQPFNLSELIDSINTIVDVQCKSKNLTFKSSLSNFQNFIYIGDSTKIKQVLINILGNATKFTPNGGNITFDIEHVAVGVKDSDIHTLRFTISDTGIGIDKAFLPKIFDFFTQEDSSSHNNYVGSGLGLAISNSIVELMGGKISVTSTKRKGSTFVVEIPLKLATDIPKIIDVHKKFDFSGKNILLAEDVQINAELIKELLFSKGANVDIAENGLIALQKFKQSSLNYYSAILMDIRMPIMDGLETSVAIRKLTRIDSNVPIIAMTANAFDDDLERSKSSGMNKHLSKPVEPEKLYTTLNFFINGSTKNATI